MPFTFAHPAIILPLNYLPKKWVSLTALVIGSLMPDLEAFIRFTSQKQQSHTWGALLWFCLPVGLLLSIVYHQLVRNSFINNMPSFLYKRLVVFTHFNWINHLKKHWPAVIISFLLGGASHLIWDSFSHFGGVLQKINPALTGNTIVWGYNIEIPYLIQYLNSVIGLLVILIVILKLPSQKKVKNYNKWWNYWMLIFIIAAIIFSIRWAVMDNFKIDDVIVSASTAFILALLLTSIWEQWKTKTARA